MEAPLMNLEYSYPPSFATDGAAPEVVYVRRYHECCWGPRIDVKQGGFEGAEIMTIRPPIPLCFQCCATVRYNGEDVGAMRYVGTMRMHNSNTFVRPNEGAVLTTFRTWGLSHPSVYGTVTALPLFCLACSGMSAVIYPAATLALTVNLREKRDELSIFSERDYRVFTGCCHLRRALKAANAKSCVCICRGREATTSVFGPVSSGTAVVGKIQTWQTGCCVLPCDLDNAAAVMHVPAGTTVDVNRLVAWVTLFDAAASISLDTNNWRDIQYTDDYTSLEQRPSTINYGQPSAFGGTQSSPVHYRHPSSPEYGPPTSPNYNQPTPMNDAHSSPINYIT